MNLGAKQGKGDRIGEADDPGGEGVHGRQNQKSDQVQTPITLEVFREWVGQFLFAWGDRASRPPLLFELVVCSCRHCGTPNSEVDLISAGPVVRHRPHA
jgi:hypothetical protein